ncbi:MAG: hypothetical protein ACI9LM_003031 [Alteromonadaceae bacterium]|jgi:hypothetical protein
MKNVSIKGILLGLVSLIVLDEFGGILLTLVLAGDISKDIIVAMQHDTLFLIFRMFVGAAALVGAGFISEKVAKSSGVINSVIIGIVSVILTVLVLGDTYPLWYLVLSYLYQFPSALAGGYIYFKRNQYTKIKRSQ